MITTRTLPRCGHTFCLSCVNRWLRRIDSCPKCRTWLEEPSPNDDEVEFARASTIRYTEWHIIAIRQLAYYNAVCSKIIALAINIPLRSVSTHVPGTGWYAKRGKYAIIITPAFRKPIEVEFRPYHKVFCFTGTFDGQRPEYFINAHRMRQFHVFEIKKGEAPNAYGFGVFRKEIYLERENYVQFLILPDKHNASFVAVDDLGKVKVIQAVFEDCHLKRYLRD